MQEPPRQRRRRGRGLRTKGVACPNGKGAARLGPHSSPALPAPSSSPPTAVAPPPRPSPPPDDGGRWAWRTSKQGEGPCMDGRTHFLLMTPDLGDSLMNERSDAHAQPPHDVAPSSRPWTLPSRAAPHARPARGKEEAVRAWSSFIKVPLHNPRGLHACSWWRETLIEGGALEARSPLVQAMRRAVDGCGRAKGPRARHSSVARGLFARGRDPTESRRAARESGCGRGTCLSTAHAALSLSPPRGWRGVRGEI